MPDTGRRSARRWLRFVLCRTADGTQGVAQLTQTLAVWNVRVAGCLLGHQHAVDVERRDGYAIENHGLDVSAQFFEGVAGSNKEEVDADLTVRCSRKALIQPLLLEILEYRTGFGNGRECFEKAGVISASIGSSRSISFVARGKPCNAIAMPPMTAYSTP